MPYDEDLARIKAEMLMKSQPSYDDGASLLEPDPNMMQVGLFGKGPKPVKPMEPPIDVQRRSILGLHAQEQAPVPAIRPQDIPVPTSNFPAPVPTSNFPAPVPQQPPTPTPEPTQPISPLNDLANKALNKPVSRREVLKKTGQAALNQVLPTPKISDVVPEITSPLTDVVKPMFEKNGTIDLHLGDYMHHAFSDAYEQEPHSVAQGMWLLARDYLKDRITPEKLDSMDELAKTPKGKYREDSSDDMSDEDAHELYIHMQHQLTHNLKPHEMVDVLSNLHQHDYDNRELYDDMANFYQYDPRSYQPKFAGLGLKPKRGDRSFEFESLVSPEEFSNYLDESWEQVEKESKAKKGSK